MSPAMKHAVSPRSPIEWERLAADLTEFAKTPLWSAIQEVMLGDAYACRQRCLSVKADLDVIRASQGAFLAHMRDTMVLERLRSIIEQEMRPASRQDESEENDE